MTFSEKLLSLRRRRGLSQDQLAELLGVSRQSVSKWESQQTLPEPGKLILISEIFGVSLDRLLKEDLTLEDAEPAPEEHTESEAPLPARADVHLDTVFCTQCGRENSADSVFCGYCGAPFTAYTATDERTKADMDLAYYRANLQLQQQQLQIQEQELQEKRRQTEQQRQQLRLQRKQYDDQMKCPRCGSTSLSGNAKGYGAGKGLLGAALLGPVGLAAGHIGSSKVIVTCMKCGYRFRK